MDVAKGWEINREVWLKKNIFLHSVSALQILHQCTVLSGLYAMALELRNFPLQFLFFALYSF